MAISDSTAQFVANWEGFRAAPYLDCVGIPTIGFGHVIRPGEKFTTLTREQAKIILKQDLLIAEGHIRRVLGVRYNQLSENEKTALISFVFNVGGTAFKNSTMAKMLVAGSKLAAAREFPRWNKGGSPLKPILGLTRRRNAEQSMFMQAGVTLKVVAWEMLEHEDGLYARYAQAA